MSRTNWLLLIFLRYYRHLGLRVSLYALLSLVAAFVSPFAQRYLSDETTQIMDFSSVSPVLTILASSMLAVSTFSLNIMVSAHRAAAAITTPRVHRLLLENTTTQSVLSAFIGAFVYSLTSIILYQAGFYSDAAAIVVMAMTILVVVLVILAMLRWIQHLTDLGSVDDSLRTVTVRAGEALDAFGENPSLGGQRLTAETAPPEDARPLRAPTSGYIQLIDVTGVQDCLPDGVSLYLAHRPGVHVLKGQVIGYLSADVDDDRRTQLLDGFTIGDHRTFEQDAAFGLVVLSEIASKALSPGVNDAGTAIAAIHCLKTLLWGMNRDSSKQAVPEADRVFVPVPDQNTFFDAAFAPIARDGAGTIEVAAALQHTLMELAQSDDSQTADAARKMSELVMAHAQTAGLLDRELHRLQDLEAENRV